MEPFQLNDTIAAISTPPGIGGIAVVRVSGLESIRIVNEAWKGADLTAVNSHSIHLGKYYSLEGDLLDEAVASVFIAPFSFTGENIVEISMHGSSWIQREILNDLVKRGIRIADPGEFTQRAFLNGKMDLAQAEGVMDLISSSSKAAHDMALNQTKGTFSKEFHNLREKLIEFASLLELELDFSEEDVEFADRARLIDLCKEVLDKINSLASSFSRGNVLKNGVHVVIAGIPNAGKSSLLNLLLNDDKAIVTDIPGTTRDIIEDIIEIDGILYRFIDTAGIRETSDKVEGIGVKRAYEALDKAFIIIWVIDPTNFIQHQLSELQKFKDSHPDKNIIVLLNKSDLPYSDPSLSDIPSNILFSTKTGIGLEELLAKLKDFATAGHNPQTDILVTNARHFESLTRASESLTRALSALSCNLSSNIETQNRSEICIPSDLVAQDIREAISHLSTITGEISSEDLLHSIFSRFCIGK